MSTACSVAPADRERAFDQSFDIHPDWRYLLHNRTPKVVRITREGYGEVLLAPLAQRVMRGDRLAPFADALRPLRQRYQVRVRRLGPVPNGRSDEAETDAAEKERSSAVAVVLAVLAALAATACVAYDVFVHGTLTTWETAVALCVLVLLISFVIGRSASRERERIKAERKADTDEGDIEFGVGGTFYDGNDTARRTKQISTLLMVVLVGAILPAVAIFVATDAIEFLEFKGGLAVKDGLESRLVSRVIVAIYTAVLALFPALMYFQFDRQRVGTIRGQWVRAIFRLDPQMNTLADVEARYGDRLAEASSYATDSGRFLGGRHSPIVIATILISVGWTMLVLRTDSYDFAGATELTAHLDAADSAAERARDAAGEEPGHDLEIRAHTAETAVAEAARASAEVQRIASESNDEPPQDSPDEDRLRVDASEESIDEAAVVAEDEAVDAHTAANSVQQPYFQLLVPTPSTATMAFLGAYFFAVYLVLRSYFSGDLRPKLYNQITARLVTVVILAYLLTVVWAPASEGNEALLTIAFVAGVVPTTVLQRIGTFRSSLLTTLVRDTPDADPGLRKGQSVDPATQPADPTVAAGEPPAGPVAVRSDGTKPNALRSRPVWESLANAFVTQRPLTQVDGIDIYESARLESEGISDIPALAKSDLVTMMVNTRLPVERLVDWTDQAMLVLLASDDPDQTADPIVRVKKLRRLGIRTASCLGDVAARDEGDGLRKAVEEVLGDGDDRGAVLEGLKRQIAQEPSVERVRNWYAAALSCNDPKRQTIHARHPQEHRQRPSPGDGSNGDSDAAAGAHAQEPDRATPGGLTSRTPAGSGVGRDGQVSTGAAIRS